MADSTTLVDALLRRAKIMGEESGRKWIESQHAAALEAVLAGDEEVTSLSFEGGQASTKRGINAQGLLEACELALQNLDGDAESGPLLPRFADIPR